MGDLRQLSDIDLAALVASKICHDAIGPMTAIGFGLDVLDEDDEDDEQRQNAQAMIRNGIGAITAKLQYARLAFGAAGSSGHQIDAAEVESVARRYVESDGKYRLDWSATPAALPKNNVKLLLNLVAIGLSTVPRGGTVSVLVEGEGDKYRFTLRCVGEKARIPAGVEDLIAGTPADDVDARSVQPYFTGRVAKAVQAGVSLAMEGDDAIIAAA